MGLTRFYWVLLGFTGFHWIVMDSIEFNWVLLGFTGLYLVELGLTVFFSAEWSQVHMERVEFITRRAGNASLPLPVLGRV